MKRKGILKGSDRMRPRNRRVIRTDLLRENMRRIREIVPAETKIMAVVKADGYGHGSAETARAAVEGGAEYLAVASVEEGIFLRHGGISVPILVLGAVTESDVRDGVENGLIQTVCSPNMVRLCECAAAAAEKKTEVHLKIDTGMGRIGVRNTEEAKSVTDEINRSPHVQLTGVFTHFSDADGGPDGMEYTDKQLSAFREMTELLPDGIIRHCANSAAIHRKPDSMMDMVRAGISLYGYPPVPENNPGLQICMRWTAKISFIKEITAGEYISYGRTYRTDRTKRIATVTCGYADGYPRCAGEQAEVLIHGKRAKILGRICMDQMMADITDIPEARTEDEVVLMGSDGEERITAEDIAKWAGTISYEILLSAGSRVERIFSESETVDGGRDR